MTRQKRSLSIRMLDCRIVVVVVAVVYAVGLHGLHGLHGCLLLLLLQHGLVRGLTEEAAGRSLTLVKDVAGMQREVDMVVAARL